MKPLTIEELKALEVDDWIWIVDLNKNRGRYLQKGEYSESPRYWQSSDKTFNDDYPYDVYGIDWIAYKNKEQAEAKGELVELPCKLGDIVWFFGFNDKTVCQGKVIGMRFNIYTPSNPIWIRVQYDIPMIKKDCDTEVWASMVFDTKAEAEARLKELRGE